jgi:hypothetical protein
MRFTSLKCHSVDTPSSKKGGLIMAAFFVLTGANLKSDPLKIRSGILEGLVVF